MDSVWTSSLIPFNGTELISIFVDSFHEFPWLRARVWMAQHDVFSIQICLLYIVSIFSIQSLMKGKDAFRLEGPIKVWNGFLAVFSTILAVGMSGEFFSTVINRGLNASVCEGRTFFSGWNGFFVWLFHLSKLFELLDTFFIVLRKRELIFLHWYHHALTLYFCWWEYPSSNAFTRWGIYLNSVVHSLMYTYFFVRSLGVSLPRSVSRSLTTIQIGQFLLAFWSLIHTTYVVYVRKERCEIDTPVFLFGWFIDVSYLILFINFYMHTYVWNKRRATKKRE